MIHAIEVENIKCGGCMNSIKHALLKIQGINTVSVQEETVTVEAEIAVERDTLIKTLEQIGYPEKGNNDLFKKAKSYVSCMVGRIQDEA